MQRQCEGDSAELREDAVRINETRKKKCPLRCCCHVITGDWRYLVVAVILKATGLLGRLNSSRLVLSPIFSPRSLGDRWKTATVPDAGIASQHVVMREYVLADMEHHYSNKDSTSSSSSIN